MLKIKVKCNFFRKDREGRQGEQCGAFNTFLFASELFVIWGIWDIEHSQITYGSVTKPVECSLSYKPEQATQQALLSSI